MSFITEGYKMLPSGSGDNTSPPTCQVSKEISSFASGTYVQLQACSPSRPTTLIVWVNIMWLMSLVLGIASAMFAISKPRWALKSTQVAMTVGLLHLSVFLFLGGLVLFFFTIYKTVAIVISVTVGLFVIVYLTLTILACLRRNCAYHTSLSDVWLSNGERQGYK